MHPFIKKIVIPFIRKKLKNSYHTSYAQRQQSKSIITKTIAKVFIENVAELTM